jgi:hypothetical protein
MTLWFVSTFTFTHPAAITTDWYKSREILDRNHHCLTVKSNQNNNSCCSFITYFILKFSFTLWWQELYLYFALNQCQHPEFGALHKPFLHIAFQAFNSKKKHNKNKNLISSWWSLMLRKRRKKNKFENYYMQIGTGTYLLATLKSALVSEDWTAKTSSASEKKHLHNL